MLEKLAAIANFADQHGEYEIASDLTQLIKNAQLFDALRTLFDPSTSELGPDSSWWKRLTRGWSKGKFDRRLGLALAINAERTKLNKKIEQLAQPLKDFSAQVAAFYDKVKSGGENYGATDFKAELSQLKSDAAKMKNLVGGKDLRKALDLRNKLNQQQIAAVEKIKGIDPEHKDFLIKLLNGEIKKAPEGVAKEEAKEVVPGATEMGGSIKRSPEQKAVSDWLKLQKIVPADYDEGFSGARSQGRAAQIYQRYGFNPFAVLQFLKENPEKKKEGVELFGPRFRKLIEDMNWAIELEKAKEQKVEKALESLNAPKEEVVPAPAAAAPAAEAPKAEAPKKVEAPAATPAAAKPKKKLSPDAQADIATLSQVDKYERELEDKKKGKGKKVSLPEEKTPRAQEEIKPISPASDLAVSTAARTAREITRLGRVRQLAKFAQDMQKDEDLLDVLDPLDRSEDLMDKGIPEQFDEEKDYDPTQTGVDMYHGEQEEEAMRGDEDDEDGGSWGWRNELRMREKQDTLNSLLAKMEQFGRLWREAPDEGARKLIQIQLDKLQAEYDLLEEKQKLENEKKLPVGWVDDK